MREDVDGVLERRGIEIEGTDEVLERLGFETAEVEEGYTAKVEDELFSDDGKADEGDDRKDGCDEEGVEDSAETK